MKKYEFLTSLKVDSLDVSDYINETDAEQIHSFEDLVDLIDSQGGFDVEIIYYSEAMKYLEEHDPSLSASMEIAGEMGYEVNMLNSEVLASLLATRKVSEDFHELRDEIEDFFYSYTDEA